MKEDCSFNRHYLRMGFSALAVLLPMSADAKTPTTCAPVYQQCVAGEACGNLEIGSTERAACFSACSAEETQCRADSAAPASAVDPNQIGQTAAPGVEANQSE